MIRSKDILDEKDKRLRTKSNEVTFPLDDKYKKFIDDAIEMLTLSQIDEEAKKYNLRPGMGLYEYEEGQFENYIFINPKIISQSEEMIYVDGGEGCLSINREVKGIVPRCARIKAEYYDINGNKQTIRLREELAIAFQHELDHLNGILFVDRIDKNNPFKNQNIMRSI